MFLFHAIAMLMTMYLFRILHNDVRFLGFHFSASVGEYVSENGDIVLLSECVQLMFLALLSCFDFCHFCRSFTSGMLLPVLSLAFTNSRQPKTM